MGHEVAVVERPTRSGRALTATVRIGRCQHLISYRTERGPLQPEIEPFLVTALLPSMRQARLLRTDESVSRRLLLQMPRIQEILHDWEPDLTPIHVEAFPHEAASSDTGTGCAAFFSGGVDSFYTALKHRTELDALIFVHGFSRRLKNPVLRKEAQRAAKESARQLNLEFVEIETDAKDFLDAYVRWRHHHGALLAGVALSVSSIFRRVYVPGSLSHDSYFPYGSHPRLDPLWSTERLEMIYDGYEANRFDKVVSIASNETAMSFLRVCSNPVDDSFNCGRCEKCLRTMVALHIVGALESCKTLPHQLDPRWIGLVRLSPATRELWVQNLQAARIRGCDDLLIDILSFRCDGASGTARRVVRLGRLGTRQKKHP